MPPSLSLQGKKIFFLGKLKLTIYRGKAALWRRLAEIETIDLKAEERSLVWEVAAVLADLARLPRNNTYLRIKPHSEEELRWIQDLQKKLQGRALAELREPTVFADLFLRFRFYSWQVAFVEDQARQIVVRWTRQSGKTTTFAAKALHYCLTRPGSQALITAPGLRQSMIVSDKIEEHLHRMDPVARRAWVRKVQRQSISFQNGSRIKALPYSLHRLRGETCDLIFVDEAAFIPDDEILFDNILKPMLATRWQRGAQLIASSTPWGRNNLFYRFCQDPTLSKEWSQHHVSWEQPVAEGLIPGDFIEKQRREIALERFQREYCSEFVEDADAWLPQDLIARCQDAELEYWEFEDAVNGKELYVGVDLGKKQDYSVIGVFEKAGDLLRLVHLKVFDLETPYAAVIGYLKILSERWRDLIAVGVDQTGVGAYIVEDMENAGIPNLTGVTLTLPLKEQVFGYLKQQMLQGYVKLPYDQDLITELNIEKFELTKDGHIRFSHPEGSHDDRLFAVALGVWASKGESVGVVVPI